MYGTDSFSSDALKKFEEWYEEEKAKNIQFVMKNEIVKYCKMDVNILR